MAIESWLTIAGSASLLLAAVGHGLTLLDARGGRQRWRHLSFGARLGAGVVLGVALVLMALAHGRWSPFDLRQVLLSLALATLLFHELVAWHTGASAVGLIVSPVALALALPAAFGGQLEGCPSDCAQCSLPYAVAWGLLLMGAGASVTAGSAGLALALQGVRRRLGWERERASRQVSDTHAFLQDTSTLTLILLGSGLAVGAWWTWQAKGQLAGLDPRQGWLAAAWLLTATSGLAWRLGSHSARWAAALAVLAAAVATFGSWMLW